MPASKISVQKTSAPKIPAQQNVPMRIWFREYTESLLVAVILALILRFFVISAYKIPTNSMAPTLKIGDFIFAYKLTYGVPIPFSGGERWGLTLPNRGDVVVFRYPGNESVSYVKRVVGLPGDRIALKNKRLYINDAEASYQPPLSKTIADDRPRHEQDSTSQTVEERFPGSTHLVMQKAVETSEAHPANAADVDPADLFGPVVVPPGHIFVLGDNRDAGDDSRYWGTVPVRHLEGRVIAVWMSFDWLNRWGGARYPSIRWERVLRSVR